MLHDKRSCRKMMQGLWEGKQAGRRPETQKNHQCVHHQLRLTASTHLALSSSPHAVVSTTTTSPHLLDDIISCPDSGPGGSRAM